MDKTIQTKVHQIIEKLDTLVLVYGGNPLDAFSDGNVAVCIIDEQGNIYGKIWGKEKLRGRRTFNLACTKATQVWITGMKTGEYEKKLFNDEFDEGLYGIQKPDLIGWEGGQPVQLLDGTELSVGFSGFRGLMDLEIIIKAIETI